MSGRRGHIIQALVERDGALCFYCDQEISYRPQVDHVVASIRGGSDNIENFVLACQRCNIRKRAMPGWYFLLLEVVREWEAKEYREAFVTGAATYQVRGVYRDLEVASGW